MRYRKLTTTGDYSFGGGVQSLFIDNAQAVAQAIKTRLLLAQGEWFLDSAEGTPYRTQILGKTKQTTYDNAIRQRILGTENVTEITSYSSSVVNRKLTVNAIVSTIYGQVPVEVTFP